MIGVGMTTFLLTLGWGVVLGWLLAEGAGRWLAWTDRRRTQVGDVEWAAIREAVDYLLWDLELEDA